MHHKKFDDISRVQSTIEQHGRDYLPEPFDLDLCKNPRWRSNDNQKWMTTSGYDLYKGCPSSHVKLRHSGYGAKGSPSEEPYVLAHGETT